MRETCACYEFCQLCYSVILYYITSSLNRKAKIIRNNNIFPSPSTNTDSKVGSSSSNGSVCPNSDVGVVAVINNKDQPPSNPHDGGITASLDNLIGSTASCSGNKLAPLDSNDVMMLGDGQSCSPSNFLASSSIPANSSSLETVLSVTDGLSLPHSDVHMGLPGDASGSNAQSFPSNNGAMGCPASEIEATAVSSNSSSAPSSSIIHSFGSQDSAVDISDSISCIPNQDNIFEDILNELLPPSSANSGTWQFTGKL